MTDYISILPVELLTEVVLLLDDARDIGSLTCCSRHLHCFLCVNEKQIIKRIKGVNWSPEFYDGVRFSSLYHAAAQYDKVCNQLGSPHIEERSLKCNEAVTGTEIIAVVDTSEDNRDAKFDARLCPTKKLQLVHRNDTTGMPFNIEFDFEKSTAKLVSVAEDGYYRQLDGFAAAADTPTSPVPEHSSLETDVSGRPVHPLEITSTRDGQQGFARHLGSIHTNLQWLTVFDRQNGPVNTFSVECRGLHRMVVTDKFIITAQDGRLVVKSVEDGVTIANPHVVNTRPINWKSYTLAATPLHIWLLDASGCLFSTPIDQLLETNTVWTLQLKDMEEVGYFGFAQSRFYGNHIVFVGESGNRALIWLYNWVESKVRVFKREDKRRFSDKNGRGSKVFITTTNDMFAFDHDYIDSILQGLLRCGFNTEKQFRDLNQITMSKGPKLELAKGIKSVGRCIANRHGPVYTTLKLLHAVATINPRVAHPVTAALSLVQGWDLRVDYEDCDQKAGSVIVQEITANTRLMQGWTEVAVLKLLGQIKTDPLLAVK